MVKMNKKLILFLPLMILLAQSVLSAPNTDEYMYNQLIIQTRGEEAGNMSKDTSNNAEMGTIMGVPIHKTSNCVVGNCWDNDGDAGSTDHYFQYNNTPILQNTNNFTWTCWANPTTEVSQQDFSSRNDAKVDGWNFILSGTSMYGQVWVSSAPAHAQSSFPSAEYSGTWGLYTLVRNHTTSGITLTTGINTTKQASASKASAERTLTQPYTVGINIVDIGLGRDWKHSFDECNYFNYSMSDDDIGRIYDLGVAGLPLEGDTTPPVISEVTDLSGGGTNTTDDTTPTFNLTTDENADCDNSADNSTWVACSTTGALGHICTIPTAQAFSIGTDKNAYIKCDDAIPNTAYGVIVYNITDGESPVVFGNTSGDGRLYVYEFNNTISIIGNATDNHNPIFTMTMKRNTTLIYTNITYKNSTLANLTAVFEVGTWSVNISAIDNHSNQEDFFYNFSVRNDTIAPIIGINDTGEFFIADFNNTFDVGFNATDNMNSTFSLDSFLNGSLQSSDADYANGTTVSVTLNQGAGFYNFTVIANDGYNNIGTSSLFFEVQNNTESPVITLLAPANNSFGIKGVNVTKQFNFTCIDTINTTLSAVGYLNDTQIFESVNYESGSTAEMNFTITEIGFYEWNVSCSDPYNNNGTKFFFYEVRNDTSPPIVSNVKFFALNSSNDVIGENEKSFNSTNLQIIELMMINYTVTDANQIDDNYSLYFTANGSTPCSLGNKQSSTCISFPEFIEFRNGSDTQYFDDTFGFSKGDSINCTFIARADNRERNYTCIIDEHYNPNVAKHYPLNWSNVTFQSGVNQRIKVGTIWKIDLNSGLVPDNATFYKLDFRVEVSGVTPTEPLLGFACNSLYNDTLGDVQSSSNCNLIASKMPSELQDDGTKFRGIFARNLTDALGNLSHIVIATDEVTGYYSMKTVEYIGNEGIWATISNDTGVTYSTLTGGFETELNINWFYNKSDDSENTGIVIRIQTEDNRSNKGNSSNFTMNWDLPSTNFPPIVNLIFPEIDINTSSIDPITWTTSEPNGDRYTTNITVHNVTKTTIAANLADSISSFDWSVSGITTGRYNLTVRSCENTTAELFCGNDTHEIFFDEIKPKSFFANESLIGGYRILAANSSDPIYFNVTDDFYQILIVNISVNNTEVYFNATYVNGTIGLLRYSFFVGFWIINLTARDGSGNLNWTTWEIEIEEIPVNFTYNVNDCYNASSLGDCFAVNWSKAFGQINWSKNETLLGGNHTWNFTDLDIPPIPPWLFNLTNLGPADVTVNITLNFTDTSRWQLFYRGNNLTTDTTFKGFINVSGFSTVRVNLSLNVYNLTQQYVNWTLNRSTADWGFNFTLNATTRTAG